MKKISLFVAAALILTFSGCTNTEDSQSVNAVQTEIAESSVPSVKPDLMQIRNICELATIECCYNNVAKSTKEAGSGLLHIGETERRFWIEYQGTAKIGIDMSEIKMNITENKISITMPKAKILSISVVPESYNEDSYVISSDNFVQKNPITAEDQTNAIKMAQEQIKSNFESNTAILNDAQDRAKKLIENYINQIGSATNAEYSIEWIFE